MKRYILFLAAIFVITALSAQDLIIEYDYLNKTSAYFKIDKRGDTLQVRSPLVKQNQDVLVRVINFNELALAAETEVSNETLVESTNPFGMFSMLSPIFNVASKDVLSNIFDKSGVDISDVDYMLGFSADEAADDSQLAEAREEFISLNQSMFDLSLLEERIGDLEYGLNQLYQLSRNTNLKGDAIKEQARQIVSGTLKNGDQPKLTNFYRTREEILSQSSSQLRTAKRASQGVLRYTALEDEPNFGFSSNENAKLYSQITKETEALMQAINDFETSYTKEEVEQMLQMMQELYFAIQNSSFTYNTNALAEGDRTNINLSFFNIPPIGTVDNEDDIETEEEATYEDDGEYDYEYEEYKAAQRAAMRNAEVVRTKSFKVKVSGGLKITPSVGITFPSYLNNSKDYYAQGDTLIVETKGDNYTPNITAFVNFYPYTGRAVNFGGTFGVGIPLKGSISPSFMLGGALILGSKYSITITGGMATGPVTRLERGMEPGMEIPLYDDIETRTKYAVGFYTGISFTLGVGN
ncbi:MAG: hypothetical protein GY751_00450 [Bacteroidetes bacterium]|nr:hypothetical protein [Bacteroidota bacterium]